MSVSSWSLAVSATDTVEAIHLASGESCGSVTSLTRARSSEVTGRWAPPGFAHRPKVSTAPAIAPFFTRAPSSDETSALVPIHSRVRWRGFVSFEVNMAQTSNPTRLGPLVHHPALHDEPDLHHRTQIRERVAL